jgi:hypothetical protein
VCTPYPLVSPNTQTFSPTEFSQSPSRLASPNTILEEVALVPAVGAWARPLPPVGRGAGAARTGMGEQILTLFEIYDAL